VALDRQGKLIKINKGLHRLAMAQVVGLKKLPVRVRAVHRLWWNKEVSGPDNSMAEIQQASKNQS
jgi:hypothetical protein